MVCVVCVSYGKYVYNGYVVSTYGVGMWYVHHVWCGQWYVSHVVYVMYVCGVRVLCDVYVCGVCSMWYMWFVMCLSRDFGVYMLCHVSGI